MKFEKDVQKQETMWENQHEHAAEKIYAMCSEMGGFFLKVFCLQTLLSENCSEDVCYVNRSASIDFLSTPLLLFYCFQFENCSECISCLLLIIRF